MPIPKRGLAVDAEAAAEIAREIGFPVVLKAQVLTGGRGKASPEKPARVNLKVTEEMSSRQAFFLASAVGL